MRDSRAWRQAITPTDRLEALTRVAEAAPQTITENANLVRLMLHEPDAAPDMVDEMWVRNLALGYTPWGCAARHLRRERF